DHLHGHVAALFLEREPVEPPFLCLLASGGHTLLLDVRDRSGFRRLGTTIDDAAGEAFDKGARLLGLGYPGGAALDRLAREGDPEAYAFPVARVPGFDFSFSGLKTALLYTVRDLAPEELERRRADLAASYPRALVALVAAAALVATSGGARTKAPTSSASWIGLAGAPRPRVALGQRMIVVLRSPSLADRVARAGGLATEKQERSWTAAALASQNVLISRLGVQGVRIRTEFRYARVLNGFSAALDARALSLLERAPEVAGVYPVRAAYPSTISSRAVRTLFAAGS